MKGKQQVENASFLFIKFRFILFLAKVGQMQSGNFAFLFFSQLYDFLHEKLFSVSTGERKNCLNIIL